MKPDFDGEPGKYTYQKDEYGKSAWGIIKPGAQSERNQKAQRDAGGEERREYDQGGHLIPHAAGGENTERNLDAQAANVNQRGVRSLERKAIALSKDPNNKVFYGVENYHYPGHTRPDATMITIAVRNEQTGEIDGFHISMTNEQYEEQEKWREAIERMDSEEDINPENDWLTPEERALANEYADMDYDEIQFLGEGRAVRIPDGSFEREESKENEMESGEDQEESEYGGFYGGME